MPDTHPATKETETGLPVRKQTVRQQPSPEAGAKRVLGRPASQRYGYAVLSVALMTLLRMLLHPMLQDSTPFVTYFVAIISSAWIGGLGPGILSVLLSAFLAWFLFIPPMYSLVLTKPTNLPALGIFVCVGFAMSALGEAQRRAHERAEDAHQQTRRILESITDGFVALDRDWRFTYANAEAESITGKARGELLGKNLWELFPEARGTRLEEEYRRAVAQQVPVAFESYDTLSDEWFSVKAYPADEGGLSVYFRNITASKRAEEALRTNEQWLKTTLTSIGDAVIVTDRKGKVTFMNPVAESLTGWKLEEALNKPLEEVFVIVQEATRQKAENPVEKVLKTGAVQGLANHTLLIAKEGTERPIDDSAAPIYAGAEVTGVVLVFRDVTERRHEEMALHASEERFRILAEAMPQFVWVSNAEGKVEYVNKRWTEYTGQTVEQTGPQDDAVIHPEDASIMWERWQEAKESGTDYEVEFRCRRVSDGVYRWFLARGVPKKDAQGRITRWIGTSTDIDAQKQAEAEIVLLNNRLQRAVYESSHRIKNHLQTLAATIDLALMEGRALIPADEFRRLGAQVRTLSALQDILTVEWKASTSGSVETISSRTLLEKVLGMLRQATASQMTYEIAEVMLSVKSATALALIINEAVANAIKHGKQSVGITLRVEEGIGLLEVYDDGPGFPEGFDPQSAANTGLELIASLVEHDLRGTLRYENRAEGGACVIISFPILFEDSLTAPTMQGF